MPPQVLRPYQLEARVAVFAAWKAGARKLLIVSPTGSGKTSFFASLVSDLVATNRRAVVLVHRRELATQAATRFTEFGADFGYIMAGEPSKPYARLQLASVQTLVRRAPMPPADLVVCDEAHLSTAKTWQTVLDAYPNARILGVTATPWRLSGKPLAGSYDQIVVVATPAELRDLGFLCRYVGFSFKTPDLSGVKTTGGDYNERQSAAVMSESVIVDNIVEEWLKHARELSTVVFAVTVEHSKQLTARFRAAGVASEHLDGGTSLEQRKAILQRVQSGQTRVLCNVGVAVEGLDIPRLKCCVLARPTKSLARAIQMMGRVRRPWNGQVARIHDHAFVIRQHGLPDDPRDYTLTAKPEKPPNLTTCPECFAMYTGPRCPNCDRENVIETVEREIRTIADAEQVTFASGDETAEPAPRPDKPTDVRWDSPGRTYEGILQRKWQAPTDYGMRWFYLVRGAKRDYRLPGTTQLDALMKRVQIPDAVWVTYLGDEPIGNDRRLKRFRVEVDDGH